MAKPKVCVFGAFVAEIVVDDRTRENAIVVVQGACGRLTIAEVEAARQEIATSDIFLTQLELPFPPTIRGIEIAHEAGVPVILNPAPALRSPSKYFRMWITCHQTNRRDWH